MTALADTQTVSNSNINGADTAPPTPPEPLIDTLRDTILSPTDPKFGELIGTIAAECEKTNTPLLSSIPESGEVPAGMDIAIVPLRKSAGSGHPKSLVGIAIAPVPTLTAIADHEHGSEWLVSLVNKRLTSKIKMSIMPKDAGSKPLGILPSKTEDYIVSNRSAFDMGGFNLVANAVTKLLRRRIPTIDKRILRQCLESQAFAESVYGNKVSADDWLAVLDKMRIAARAKGEDVAVFDHWEATRNEIVIETPDDDEEFDAEMFNNLVS